MNVPRPAELAAFSPEGKQGVVDELMREPSPTSPSQTVRCPMPRRKARSRRASSVPEARWSASLLGGTCFPTRRVEEQDIGALLSRRSSRWPRSPRRRSCSFVPDEAGRKRRQHAEIDGDCPHRAGIGDHGMTMSTRDRVATDPATSALIGHSVRLASIPIPHDRRQSIGRDTAGHRATHGAETKHGELRPSVARCLPGWLPTVTEPAR